MAPLEDAFGCSAPDQRRRGRWAGTLARVRPPALRRARRDWGEARPVDDMPASDLLVGVEELLEAGAEYYTSVQTIIPLAAIARSRSRSSTNGW